MSAETVSLLYTATMDSPLGALHLATTDKGLCSVEFGVTAEEAGKDLLRRYPSARLLPDAVPLAEACHQLHGYFMGQRAAFELPLDPLGTPFQIMVWEALTRIPMGRTWSYGELAREVGSPQGFRAVGMANRCNPIAIVVPCHRVIGSDGSLTGYAGGLDAKRWLLEHERRIAGPLRLF